MGYLGSTPSVGRCKQQTEPAFHSDSPESIPNSPAWDTSPTGMCLSLGSPTQKEGHMSNALRASAAHAKLAMALTHSVHQVQAALGITTSDIELLVVSKMQRACCPRFVESIEVQGIVSASMYPHAPEIAYFHDRETRPIAILPYSTRDMAVHECTSLLNKMEDDLDKSSLPDFHGKFVPMEFRLLDQFDELVAIGVIHNRAIDWLTPGPSKEGPSLREKASQTETAAKQLAQLGQIAASQVAKRQADQLAEDADMAEHNAYLV